MMVKNCVQHGDEIFTLEYLDQKIKTQVVQCPWESTNFRWTVVDLFFFLNQNEWSLFPATCIALPEWLDIFCLFFSNWFIWTLEDRSGSNCPEGVEKIEFRIWSSREIHGKLEQNKRVHHHHHQTLEFS